MHPNAQLIDALLRGVRAPRRRRDGRVLRARRHASAIPCSTSPAAEVGAMWAMLCARGKDLRVEWRDVRADDRAGRRTGSRATPTPRPGARCTTSSTPTFTFRDGRIAAHVDRFDLWRWSRMALGAKGCCSAGRRWCATRSARRRGAARRLDRPRTPLVPARSSPRARLIVRGRPALPSTHVPSSCMSFAPNPRSPTTARRGSACCSSTSARPTRRPPSAVRRYLAEFLSDPRVVEIPRVLWQPILHGVILRVRPAEVRGEVRGDLDQGRLAAARALAASSARCCRAISASG